MEREDRRYFRYDVDLPVRLGNPLRQSFTAQVQNVSEGGLAIKLIEPVRLEGVLIVEFELSSVEPQIFHAKADVVWSESFVMGLRFLYIEKHSGVALQTWLSSLEARIRFPGIGSTNLLTTGGRSSGMLLKPCCVSASSSKDS
jgi:PilZ domain